MSLVSYIIIFYLDASSVGGVGSDDWRIPILTTLSPLKLMSLGIFFLFATIYLLVV
jgi:hypothetical protein